MLEAITLTAAFLLGFSWPRYIKCQCCINKFCRCPNAYKKSKREWR